MLIYPDDIVTYSPSPEQHLKDLDNILSHAWTSVDLPIANAITPIALTVTRDKSIIPDPAGFTGPGAYPGSDDEDSSAGSTTPEKTPKPPKKLLKKDGNVAGPALNNQKKLASPQDGRAAGALWTLKNWKGF